MVRSGNVRLDVQPGAWEGSLVARAYEALDTRAPETVTVAGCEAYAEAYKYCARLIRSSSRTFYFASGLLPRAKRQAVRALYAFCRATDDVIDQAPPDADILLMLEKWRARLATYPNAYDPVPLAWFDTKTRFHVPSGYEAQLIEGIARDVCQNRYGTFAELSEYCYGVASTVGLMAMHIIGFAGEQALPYAVKLGVALQLTNILRDVGIDWQAGRLYLPQDELVRFGVTEEDVARGCVNERWRALMRFQIARARALYAQAEPGIALLVADGRFAIAAAARLYAGILADIEAHDFDVFHRRARMATWDKVRRLPNIWWWAAQTRPRPAAPDERPGDDVHVVMRGASSASTRKGH